MDQKSLVRIIEMDNLIKHNKYPNCKYFQKHLKVSERTVLRDIDILKKTFHAPIKYSKSNNGYFYSEPSFVLKNVKLTEGDLVALLIGQNVLDLYKKTPYYDDLLRSFQKITILLPDYIQIKEKSVFDISVDIYESLMMGKKNIRFFRVILAALSEGKRLKIEYIDILDNRKVVDVIVSPMQLKCISGEWCLFCFDHSSNRKSKINVKRISTIRKLNTKALEMEPDKLASIQDKNDQELIKAEFSKEVSDILLDKLSETTNNVELLSNGKLRVDFIVTDSHSLYQWLLSFGSQVQIIEPVSLRNKIRKDLIKMLSMY